MTRDMTLRLLRRVLAPCALVCVLMPQALAQESPQALQSDASATTATTATLLLEQMADAATSRSETSATLIADAPAVMFMNRCAGCHTVGAGVRTGPDLKPTAAWKMDDLLAAVKRMEKNVGPMSNDEVSTMAQFLRDSGANDRIAKEEARRAIVAMAQLEPASPHKGRDLFFGRAPLANRGPNCAACHTVGGQGGNLGLNLTNVKERFGDMALVSAIEKPAFRIMTPVYAAHPVTKQEATHIAAYLKGVENDGVVSAAPPPVGAIGGSIAGVIIAFLAVSGIRRRPGIRARLVSEANRR